MNSKSRNVRETITRLIVIIALAAVVCLSFWNMMGKINEHIMNSNSEITGENAFSCVIDTYGNYVLIKSNPGCFSAKTNLYEDLAAANLSRLESADDVAVMRSDLLRLAGGSSEFNITLNGQAFLLTALGFDNTGKVLVTIAPISAYSDQTREIMGHVAFIMLVVALIIIIVLALVFYRRKQKDLKAQQIRLKEAEGSRKLIDSVASSYNVAYVVNMADDSFVQLRMDKDIIGNGETFFNFSQAKSFFVNLLPSADRERMRRELDYDTIRERLSSVNTYTVEYRVPINGAMIWHEMSVTAVDNDSIAVGFVMKDLEITRHHLEGKRYEEYFALYEVDIDTETAKIVKDSPWYELDRAGTALPYSSTMWAFASSLEGDAREFFLKLSDMEFVKQELATEDKHTYSYRSSNVGEGSRWVDCTSYVTLRHDDGTPAMFSLGFSWVDSAGAARQELQSKITENLEFIGALAADYSSVYYIDIESEKITPYSMNEQTRVMMSDIFATNDLYPQAFKAYVEHFVYEPDREMMFREGARNNVLSHLAKDNSFEITFRGINEGVVMFCEMKFVVAHRDEDKIKSVGLGFAYKDDEIMAQYINEKLVSEYISAFMVDLDSDYYRIYRHPDTTTTMDREDRVWSLAMADFAAECDPEYYDLVKNIGSPEFLKKELAHIDRREYLYRFPSASKPWRRCVVQVLDRVDGVPSNVVATFMGIDDYQAKINEQKRQLEIQQIQLERALASAQQANKAKTEFLFNMSHDIRTPMNAILGFTSMAQKHIGDREKVEDCLEKTQQSGNLLLSLINSVLDMSRIESGSAESEEKAGDVYYSFANIETTLMETAAARDVDLSFEFGEITDRYVYADFDRCIRVFTNLITNAIKYSREGGYVKVRCEQAGPVLDGYVLFKYTVEDNGIGMSEEFQKHMFETFTREHNSTTSGIQGTGLGLSVCKTFVDYLKGRIECISKLGVGTKFTVILPFRVQDGEQYTDPHTGKLVSAEEHPSYEAIDFTGKKTLLVEDNELNREIARDILEEHGLVIDEAEDGKVAVDILKKRGPDYYDFILMDIQMPIMNGYEATRAIRDMYPDAKIPIIAVSANAFEEDKRASIAAGMDNHVAKPINVDELFSALAKFI